MDQKTYWGFMPVLCGTEAISLSRAEQGVSFVASSRLVVHVKEKLWAGEGPLAASQQEACVPKFSQTSTSSTEEGKVRGRELPYSYSADLPARVGPILIA